jgi:hypothetical protein
MSFIVIELFNNLCNVCTDEDGQVNIFKTMKEAQGEADSCQEGMVIDLDGDELVTITKREYDGLKESHRMLVRDSRRYLKAMELLTRHNLMWLLDQEVDEPEATESRLKDNETLRLFIESVDLQRC